MFHTYILWSESRKRYYIGHTENLEQRIKEHNDGKSLYTNSGRPWKLVYCELFETRSDAAKREQHIKNRKSKKYIEVLIAKGCSTGSERPVSN